MDFITAILIGWLIKRSDTPAEPAPSLSQAWKDGWAKGKENRLVRWMESLPGGRRHGEEN